MDEVKLATIETVALEILKARAGLSTYGFGLYQLTEQDRWVARAAIDAMGGIMDAAIAAERERCAMICEQQAEAFKSPEYASGQPLSSVSERFACGCCAEAIRKGKSA